MTKRKKKRVKCRSCNRTVGPKGFDGSCGHCFLNDFGDVEREIYLTENKIERLLRQIERAEVWDKNYLYIVADKGVGKLIELRKRKEKKDKESYS